MSLTVEEIIGKVKSANLKEFGVYHESIADKWENILANAADWDGEMAIAVGLNNSDIDKALLAILKDDADKVIEGIGLAATVLGAAKMELHVPEGEADLAAALAAKCEGKGIEVVEGFVNTRDFRGKAVHHIETMKALAEIAADAYEPGVLMAVKKDGKIGDLKKVAYGTKLTDITGDLAGIKAVMISTNVYKAEAAAEIVIDADTVAGNGVITLIPDTECMIAYGEEVLMSERVAGCGKCTFCREGLGQIQAIFKDITEAQGKAKDVALVKEIGEAMQFSTMCSLGQTGSDVALSILDQFDNEVTDHIKKKKCTVGKCAAFMTIYIDPSACTGCEDCADVCPVEAIEGKKGYIHMIDEFTCTKCGKCITACDEDAVVQTTDRVPKLPTKLTKVGKFKKR